MGIAHGATAGAASTAGAGMHVDMEDPVPAVIAPPVTTPPAVDMDTGTTRASAVNDTAQSGGRRRKRKYAPANTERRQRRYCSDNKARTPDGGRAQAGEEGGSGA